MKRKITIKPIALLLAAAMLATGCSAKPPAEEEEFRQPVETQAISRTTIKSELAYAGVLTPLQSVAVTGKMGGKVENTYFEVGDTVNAGDALYSLDKRDVQNQIRQLESQLNVTSKGVQQAQSGLKSVTGGQYEAQVLQMENAVENAKKQVQNAQIALDNANLALDNAKDALDRTTMLYENGVATKVDLDNVQMAYDQRLTTVEQAEIGLSTATAGLAQAEETLNISTGAVVSENREKAQIGIAQAQASQQSVQVQLSIARETLGDTTVTSPISGVVSAKNAKQGETYGMQMPAYTIVDMRQVLVSVKVSELMINLLSVGQTVDVRINALGEKPVKGTIKTISPAADQSNTYPVEIVIDNPDSTLKPGMFAEVSFLREQSENTIAVPRSTVLEDAKERYVFIDEAGIARRVVVTTGIDNGQTIEILSGLKDGDQVIITGHTYVRDGDKINVVKKY